MYCTFLCNCVEAMLRAIIASGLIRINKTVGICCQGELRSSPRTAEQGTVRRDFLLVACLPAG